MAEGCPSILPGTEPPVGSRDRAKGRATTAVPPGQAGDPSDETPRVLQGRRVSEEQIVKSRSRVKSHGEVFTPRHMVDRMLDLVSSDLETGPDFVDRTFLEPAAGDGNFLVAILTRKLRAIEHHRPVARWAHESLFALASIYGIELLDDNHADAKATMLEAFLGFHESHSVRCGPGTNLRQAAVFLIDTNIIRGNALTGETAEGKDIEFSWWNRVEGRGEMVCREPFTLNSLRGNALDFTAYEKYQMCPIDKVHEQARAGA